MIFASQIQSRGDTHKQPKMAHKFRTIHERRLTKSHLFAVMMMTSLCWVAVDVYLFYFSSMANMGDSGSAEFIDGMQEVKIKRDVDNFEGMKMDQGVNNRVAQNIDGLGNNKAGDTNNNQGPQFDRIIENKPEDPVAQPPRKVYKRARDVVKRFKEIGLNKIEDRIIDQKNGVENNEIPQEHVEGEQKVEAGDPVAEKDTHADNDNVANVQQSAQKALDNLNPPEPEAVKPMWEKLKNVDTRMMSKPPNSTGENGVGTNVDPNLPLVKLGWKHASFNEYLSDRISLERKLPNVKPKTCNDVLYPYNVLPKTSIILCFTDESWSTLLRSVYSILNRSPPELVEEVILVDDFSTAAHLKQKLDKYVHTHWYPRVKVIHLPKREGLIRARLVGMEVAKGPVLTFLDSHIECTVGWLEPLLFRVWQEPKAVVSPLIDSVDKTTFTYSAVSGGLRGGFGWNMQFKWKATPQYEKARRKNDTEPIRTPTIAGGLFSIRKDTFIQMGTYDPGLEIWGGENLEISFKTWMCGGTLELIPCSHVGHIFRDTQPYSFPDRIKTFLKNCKRIAEVWLDDFKEAFYIERPELRTWDIGDISAQVQLRKDLHCKDFSWYMKNVASEYDIPEMNYKAKGEVSNKFLNSKCLDSANGGYLSIYPCHKKGGTQAFYMTLKGHLKSDGRCVTKYGNASPLLKMASCNSARIITFKHKPGEGLVDVESGHCLDNVRNKLELVLSPCNYIIRPMQKWRFEEYYDDTGKNRIYP